MDSVNKGFLKVFRYEEEYAVMDGKINDLVLGFKELEKKTDFSTIINRQNARLRSLEDKIVDLENELVPARKYYRLKK